MGFSYLTLKNLKSKMRNKLNTLKSDGFSKEGEKTYSYSKIIGILEELDNHSIQIVKHKKD